MVSASDKYPRPLADISAIRQFDLSSASPQEQDQELSEFDQRLHEWKEALDLVGGGGPAMVSVEIPAFKGGWLMPCIESVLCQTATCWSLSVRWDAGDDLSRRILEAVQRLDHPKIHVYFGENRGIAYNRRFLTEHSHGEYILTLDDDDMLAPDAIEKFVGFARARPWAGIVRAKRNFIDAVGNAAGADTWFPFAPRNYQLGMVTDVFNHSQPALISRAAYAKTAGWEGFAEFRSAGEDCDIFMKVEEVASIELLDEVLYYYRLTDKRTSLVITNEAAFEMWRHLADQAIARIGLPLKRVTERPPFRYEHQQRPLPTREMIDWMVCADGSDAGSRTVRSLRACGVEEDDIYLVIDPRAAVSPGNAALQRPSRPLVCILCGGIEFAAPDTVNVLLSVMHQHEADLIAPKILNPDRTVQWAEPYFSQQQPVSTGRGVHDLGKYDYVADALWLPATMLLVRREALKAVGGFTQMFADGAIVDADFSLKARLRGFRCVYAGTVAVVNHVPRAGSGNSAPEFTWFLEKWRGRLDLFESATRKPEAAKALA